MSSEPQTLVHDNAAGIASETPHHTKSVSHPTSGKSVQLPSQLEVRICDFKPVNSLRASRTLRCPWKSHAPATHRH